MLEDVRSIVYATSESYLRLNHLFSSVSFKRSPRSYKIDQGLILFFPRFSILPHSSICKSIKASKTAFGSVP